MHFSTRSLQLIGNAFLMNSLNSLDLTSYFYLFCYLLYIVVFTENLYGTEWPFMC